LVRHDRNQDDVDAQSKSRTNHENAISEATDERAGNEKPRRPRPGRGWSAALMGVVRMDRLRSAGRLFDEQHFLLGRQWPEVFGDEGFELVAGSPDGGHGRDDVVAEVFGVGEGVAFGVLVADGFEGGEVVLELLDQLNDLAINPPLLWSNQIKQLEAKRGPLRKQPSCWHRPATVPT